MPCATQFMQDLHVGRRKSSGSLTVRGESEANFSLQFQDAVPMVGAQFLLDSLLRWTLWVYVVCMECCGSALYSMDACSKEVLVNRGIESDRRYTLNKPPSWHLPAKYRFREHGFK